MQIDAEGMEEHCGQVMRPGFGGGADSFPMTVDFEVERTQPSSSLFRPSPHKVHKRYKSRIGHKDSDVVSITIPLLPSPPPLTQTEAISEIQRVVEVMGQEETEDFSKLGGLTLHEKKAMLEKLKSKVRVLEESLELARMALGKMTLG